jgi:hypothetical protein
MNISELNHERDRRLRTKMVRVVHAARASGCIGASMLRDVINGTSSGAERFSDDQHLLELGVDLENLHLVERQDLRRRASEMVSVDNVGWRITAAGSAFAEERGPKYDLLADDRI